MFIGHFGLAFAARRVAPAVSLGTTIFAAEFLDALWPLFVMAGIERVEIVPGITRMTPLDFVHYPWSHSLAMALVWSFAFGATYWLLRRNARGALVLAALVASHWLLDWMVHRPDLPLYPGDAAKYGLGLWNQPALELGMEAILFAAGIYLYVRATKARDRVGVYGFWALVAVLAIAYLAATFGPPPPSSQAVAASSLIVYVIAAWGWWIDRHREAR